MFTIAAIFLAAFRAVVIPVQFQNMELEGSVQEFTDLTKSAASYLNREFRENGKFIFTVTDVVTVPGSFERYGANSSDRKDRYLFEAAGNACSQLAGKIDFSLFDNDSDGYVDHIIFIMPWMSEADGAGSNYFWPASYHFHDDGLCPLHDGKFLDSYAIITEKGPDGKAAGPGDFCHEFIHGMGIPDFFDTDGNGSGGLAAKDWATTSIMNEGNHNGSGHNPPPFCAPELDLLGLGMPEDMTYGDYTLEPVWENGRFLKISGYVVGEYFLLESRGEAGLKIYHMDRCSDDMGYSDYYQKNLSAAERWQYNQLNCNPDFQCVHCQTGTDLVFRDGHAAAYFITDIRKAADGRVCFTVTEPVTDFQAETFQNAAILKWKPGTGTGTIESCFLILEEGTAEERRISAKKLEGSSFCCTAEGLNPGKEYAAGIHISFTDGTACRQTVKFKTKAYVKGSVPFIFFNGAERNPDGSFVRGSKIPLRVFNAMGNTGVRWYLDSETISTEPDGHYTLVRSGCLRAELTYPDGDREILLKELTVR